MGDSLTRISEKRTQNDVEVNVRPTVQLFFVSSILNYCIVATKVQKLVLSKDKCSYLDRKSQLRKSREGLSTWQLLKSIIFQFI